LIDNFYIDFFQWRRKNNFNECLDSKKSNES
jgi:hypothetical protein